MKSNNSVMISLAKLPLVGFLLAGVLALCACSSGTKTNLPDIPLPKLGLPDITHVKLPFVHRIDIQQGNVITQEMIAQLKIGMDKKKVRYIMGTPIIRDTFHAKRWDYLFTEQLGGEELERRQITLYFENQLLARVEGNVTPAAGRLVVDTRQDTTVDVPGVHQKSFFRKIKDSMPLIGEDGELPEDATEVENDTAEVIAQAEEALEENETASTDGDSNTAETSGEEITVPADAPTKKKKRGFFKRIFDSVGLGADEDEDDEIEYDTADPRYRNPAPQDEL